MFKRLLLTGLMLSAHGAGVAKHVVLVVWDGMWSDFASPERTPTLWQLRSNGTWFARHHSVFPASTRVDGVRCFNERSGAFVSSQAGK